MYDLVSTKTHKLLWKHTTTYFLSEMLTEDQRCVHVGLW